MNKNFRYSILTPYFNNKKLKNSYRHILKYNNKHFKNLHEYIYKNIKGVISSDLDYHIPLKKEIKYLGMIPNPINLNKIKYNKLKIDGEIIIFHGINIKNSIKKGNNYFQKSMKIIKELHGNKIKYIEVKNLNYNDYVKSYDSCHIFLDQVFAYDQGYNALEAMAKGKVVFTGAEKEWLDHYNLIEDSIAINALPETNYLVNKLTDLINNPEKIESISVNARKFIENHHDFKSIASIYEDKWLKALKNEK